MQIDLTIGMCVVIQDLHLDCIIPGERTLLVGDQVEDAAIAASRDAPIDREFEVAEFFAGHEIDRPA